MLVEDDQEVGHIWCGTMNALRNRKVVWRRSGGRSPLFPGGPVPTKPTPRRKPAPASPRQRSKPAGSRTTDAKTSKSARAAPRTPEPEERPSLGRVLDDLGSSVLEVLAAPRGLDVPVTEPIIYDPIEGTPIDRGAMVLAVATLPDTMEAKRLITQAGKARAAAVLFKCHGREFSLTAEAEAMGVALISIVDEMRWTQLSGLLTHAVHRPTSESAMHGIAGVPMGDLFALSNAIAAMVGGAVTVEDPRGRVLAYSNLGGQTIDEARRESILGRQIPDTQGVRGIYKRLWEADGVIRVDRIDDLGKILPRLATAVRVGGDILGSIWVVTEKALGEGSLVSLHEASRIAAMHLIHMRSSRDIERRTRADLLRALLEGRGSSTAAATRLAIDAQSPLSIIGFEFSSTDDAREELHRERLVDLVALYCEAFRRRAASVSVGPTVYAILPSDAPMTADRALKLAGEIKEHAEDRLRVPLRGAVESSVSGLSDLPRARREIDRVLRVLATDPKQRTLATPDEVRSQAILLELRELSAEAPSLLKGPIAGIVAYDAEHRSAYVLTLRAYLDAFGDVPRAAKAIDVHPNTFRYRLRRLTELFGLDLDDPEERLVIGLQSRLLPDRNGGVSE